MLRHVIDRAKVFRSLPADRRKMMKRTGLRSYEVPPILRWLQRRCLADHSNSRGVWESKVVPEGLEAVGNTGFSTWELVLVARIQAVSHNEVGVSYE